MIVNIISDTELKVHADFDASFSNETASFVQYRNTPSTFDYDDTDLLPRENSDSTCIEALTIGISNSVTTGASGTVDLKPNYNILTTFAATDMLTSSI